MGYKILHLSPHSVPEPLFSLVEAGGGVYPDRQEAEIKRTAEQKLKVSGGECEQYGQCARLDLNG